jgi:hypothetical protein
MYSRQQPRCETGVGRRFPWSTGKYWQKSVFTPFPDTDHRRQLIVFSVELPASSLNERTTN